MHKKNIVLFFLFFLLAGVVSCKKETSTPILTQENLTIENDSIVWSAPQLMPYPMYKEWNEIQDENKHLYIRGAKPVLDTPNADSFNQTASQIPQYEIDLLTQFATEYHNSFLQNQYASTNYGYNISYFDSSFVSIPYTFLSNFGGSSPEDINAILNYDFNHQKALKNEELFSPYPKFLQTLSQFCFDDLKKQFTEFSPSTPKEYMEFVSSKYDVRLLKQGTSPDNPTNFQHICLVPKGIIVFFLSGNICKSGAGIWEVFVPYESIASYSQIPIQNNAYSDLIFPPHWDMYSGEGSFIVHYPTIPQVNPEQYPTNMFSSISDDHNHGAVQIFIPVTFASTNANNFREATMKIEWDTTKPFTIPDEFAVSSQKEERIDGISFTSYETSDAAAGNIYDMKVYIGKCVKMNYQITFTIHSTRVENYDPGTVISFDPKDVYKAINEVFRSFSFR
ncbi:MAG: hypothetical protein PHI40_06295 [Caldisericia bacterium]|nr:hypothetical protein [Caldisericia bacterium]